MAAAPPTSAWTPAKAPKGVPPDLAKVGALACKLGLIEPPTEYVDGKVARAWATEDLEKEEEGEEEKGDKVKKLKHDPADAEARWQRIKDVDASCFEVLEKGASDVATPDEWKHMMLVDKETEVLMLPCVAFSGMPAQPSGAKIGTGMLLLTKIEEDKGALVLDKDGHAVAHPGEKYRLHFCMKTSEASIQAEETWGEREKGCCCITTKAHSVQSDYTSMHAMQMVGSSMDLDGNLFHVHYEVKDVATLVSTFGGETDKKGKCCDGCSCPKCPGCCSLLCGCCCSLLGACCVDKSTGGQWFSTTNFEDVLDPHITTVMQEVMRKETYKFPGIAPVQHEMERAAITKKLHTITMKYRCTQTNDVQTCEVVVKPDVKIHDIGKLTSWLSNKVAPVPQDLTISAEYGPSSFLGGSSGAGGGVAASAVATMGALRPRGLVDLLGLLFCMECYVSSKVPALKPRDCNECLMSTFCFGLWLDRAPALKPRTCGDITALLCCGPCYIMSKSGMK